MSNSKNVIRKRNLGLSFEIAQTSRQIKLWYPVSLGQPSSRPVISGFVPLASSLQHVLRNALNKISVLPLDSHHPLFHPIPILLHTNQLAQRSPQRSINLLGRRKDVQHNVLKLLGSLPVGPCPIDPAISGSRVEAILAEELKSGDVVFMGHDAEIHSEDYLVR